MSHLYAKIDNKYYGEQKIISDLSLSLEQGEFVAIIGPSGAGKTSLLNIISGVDVRFDGEISFNQGEEHCDPKALPTLGMMFQDARLLPWLTVEQNIELVFQADTRKHRSRMLTLLERVGLTGSEAKFPGQLSGGMKKRVSLVRAFINEPQVLLMDEPFLSLDEPTANSLRSLLLEFWAETKVTILFVTHNLHEALVLADRVLFLSNQPAQIILDFNVEIARPRLMDSSSASAIYTDLLAQYPNLLSGSLDKS